jgi:uncharacterized LabA/DUF88 family protein
LVSSDSDFTRLAARIREQGIDVYGFGAQKTPESFRRACLKFIYTENLLPSGRDSARPEKTTTTRTVAIKPASASAPLIRKAIDQLDSEEGWVRLSNVGNQLTTLASDFDPRTYGQTKLGDLVKKTGAFESRQVNGATYIRIKAKTSRKVTTRKRTKASAK